MNQGNIETTYGDCLSFILKDKLIALHESNNEIVTAKNIAICIITEHNLSITDFEKRNLLLRIKNKLKNLSRGGLVIINHRVTERKTIENIYAPNFKNI